MTLRCFNRDNNNKSLLASPNKPALSLQSEHAIHLNTDASNEQNLLVLKNPERSKDAFANVLDSIRQSYPRSLHPTKLIWSGCSLQAIKEVRFLSRLWANKALAYAVDYLRSLASYLGLTAQTLIKTKKDAYIDPKYVENCKNIRFFHNNRSNYSRFRLKMPIFYSNLLIVGFSQSFATIVIGVYWGRSNDSQMFQ